jgi:hypothetical protein
LTTRYETLEDDGLRHRSEQIGKENIARIENSIKRYRGVIDPDDFDDEEELDTFERIKRKR